MNEDHFSTNENTASTPIPHDLEPGFFASAAHQVRNPLSSILALAQALNDGIYDALTEKQRRAIGLIGESARALLQLTNDLSDIAKAKTGGLLSDPVPFPLDAACAQALKNAETHAQQKSIKLNVSIEHAGLAVLADPARLSQIINGLLCTSLFSAPKGSSVSLVMVPDPAAGSLAIQVMTRSVGQPIVVKDADPSPAQATWGRMKKVKCIELELIQNLIALQHGSLSVSQPAADAMAVTATLPLTFTVSEQPATKEAPSTPPMPPSLLPAHPLILVADDQDVLCTLIQDYMESRGFEVLTASNGRDAVELTRTKHPALVIMDVQMPVMGGLEAIRQIREFEDRDAANVAIISVSGLAVPGDRERCHAAGATGYLGKPFDINELEQAVTDFISRPRPHPLPKLAVA